MMLLKLTRTDVLALGAAGILAGQVVRQMRRIAQGNPVQVVDEVEETP